MEVVLQRLLTFQLGGEQPLVDLYQAVDPLVEHPAQPVAVVQPVKAQPVAVVPLPLLSPGWCEFRLDEARATGTPCCGRLHRHSTAQVQEG